MDARGGGGAGCRRAEVRILASTFVPFPGYLIAPLWASCCYRRPHSCSFAPPGGNRGLGGLWAGGAAQFMSHLAPVDIKASKFTAA